VERDASDPSEEGGGNGPKQGCRWGRGKKTVGKTQELNPSSSALGRQYKARLSKRWGTPQIGDRPKGWGWLSLRGTPHKALKDGHWKGGTLENPVSLPKTLTTLGWQRHSRKTGLVPRGPTGGVGSAERMGRLLADHRPLTLTASTPTQKCRGWGFL